jgi:hypothetical protein
MIWVPLTVKYCLINLYGIQGLGHMGLVGLYVILFGLLVYLLLLVPL